MAGYDLDGSQASEDLKTAKMGALGKETGLSWPPPPIRLLGGCGLHQTSCARSWVCRNTSNASLRARYATVDWPEAAFLAGVAGHRHFSAWFKKVSGTVVRSTLWAVPATLPDPFFNHAHYYAAIGHVSQ